MYLRTTCVLVGTGLPHPTGHASNRVRRRPVPETPSAILVKLLLGVCGGRGGPRARLPPAPPREKVVGQARPQTPSKSLTKMRGRCRRGGARELQRRARRRAARVQVRRRRQADRGAAARGAGPGGHLVDGIFSSLPKGRCDGGAPFGFDNVNRLSRAARQIDDVRREVERLHSSATFERTMCFFTQRRQ